MRPVFSSTTIMLTAALYMGKRYSPQTGQKGTMPSPSSGFSMSAAPHSQQCFCITMNVLSGGEWPVISTGGAT